MTNMTPHERRDLLKFVRGCECIERAYVLQRAQKLQADFECQLAAVYSFDNDETWKTAANAVATIAEDANFAVRARCAGLGIPHEFTPYMYSDWYQSAQNASRRRRHELCQAAASYIEARKRVALAVITRESAKIQEMATVGDLSPDRACAMFNALPSAESQMPALVMANIVAVVRKVQFA